MKEIIKDALAKSCTYPDYRKTISRLLSEGKATGNSQNEALVNYTLLNETRMNRLEKTLAITEDNVTFLKTLEREYVWLVISEGWCGDSAQLVPIFEKLASVSDHIELRLVFRDESEPLMDLFLTNGARSIPLLIILEKDTLKVLGRWGARPKPAAELIKRYKAEFGKVDEDAKTELQMWYLHDKGISTQDEIAALMKASETS
jgi:hypothetical protein